MSNWQPARVVDVVLRFNPDFGPAMRAQLEGVGGGHLSPEDGAREACRILSRAVGVATHAYVWAAPQMPVTHVRLPVNADEDGTLIALRLHLNVPMTQPVDFSNGQQVAGLLQALMGLARGSIAGADALGMLNLRISQMAGQKAAPAAPPSKRISAEGIAAKENQGDGHA